MYDAAAPYREKACAVHFFAIKYAHQIRGLSEKEIVAGAKIPKRYQTEIRKIVNLTRYVDVKVHKSPQWDV